AWVAGREGEQKKPGDPGRGEGGLAGGLDRIVDGDQAAPRHRRLGDVGGDAAIEHEGAGVGGGELLLVVERPRSGPDAEPAVALDDLADCLALLGDVSLAALEAEEGEGHLVEIE